MWIRTQNKQRIINSNQIIDIFIDKTGTKLYAETTRDGDFFELGCYKDRTTCLDILEHLFVSIGAGIPSMAMPLGGDVGNWKRDVAELSTIYISQGFKK